MSPQQKADWFEVEVRPNEYALRAYLRNSLPEGVEVDDVVQETFFRVMKIQNAATIHNARSLLFSIARNITRDHLRKKYTSRISPLRENEDSCDFPSEADAFIEQIEVSDEVELMKSAITQLPEKCRIIFLLRNYHHLPHKEIAKRLNVSVKTVETQLTIGFKKCRKFLENAGVTRP